MISAFMAILYNNYLPLHGDEAYYWLWSYHLQTGYYDHPPMIAFLIYLSNLISESQSGVRLVNIVSISVAAWVIYTLLERIKDSTSALIGVVLFLSTLLVGAGYTITTPDSPLILFWSLSLLAFYNILTQAKTADFVLLGVWLGFMMLSKYTAILFVFALLLFVFIRRRDLLFEWRTYLSVVISLAIISPMLWWNYEREWISFAFQSSHGGSGELGFGYFGEYILSQFLVFTPIFTAVLFYTLFKNRLYIKDDIRFMLVLFAITPLLFFLYKSLFIHIELNYSAPAYISATVLCALWFRERQSRRLLIVGIAIALTLTVVARSALMFYLPVVQDRMYGNKEAVDMMNRHRESSDALYSSHLTTASLITYYSPDHPSVRIPTRTRFSQYDMWDNGTPYGAGLYLSDGDMIERLKNVFDSVVLTDKLSVKIKGGKYKSFYLYRVE